LKNLLLSFTLSVASFYIGKSYVLWQQHPKKSKLDMDYKIKPSSKTKPVVYDGKSHADDFFTILLNLMGYSVDGFKPTYSSLLNILRNSGEL